GDGAEDALPGHRAQGLDVVEVGDAAGGDHRDPAGPRHGEGGVHVDALHHAVPVDVGVDDGRHPRTLELAGEVGGLDLRHLGPTVGGHQAVLGVEADDDVPWKVAAGLADEAGVLDCRGAEDHEVDAGGQVVLDGLHGADVAVDL